MTRTHTAELRTLLIAVVLLGSRAALAEEYRVIGADETRTCGTSAKTDWMTLEGRDEVTVARAEGDALSAAVCVPDERGNAVHVRWKANGYWKSSGTIGTGCAEILGASVVKVRAVNANFDPTATYRTCVER